MWRCTVIHSPNRVSFAGGSRRAVCYPSMVTPRRTSDRLRVVYRARVESSSIDTSSPFCHWVLPHSVPFAENQSLFPFWFSFSFLVWGYTPFGATSHVINTDRGPQRTTTRDLATKIQTFAVWLASIGCLIYERERDARVEWLRGENKNKSETEGTTLRTRWPVADWTRDPRVASISMEGERTTGREWMGGVGRAVKAPRTGRKGRERTRHNERSSQPIRVSNSRVGRELILFVRERKRERERERERMRAAPETWVYLFLSSILIIKH